MPNGYNRSQEGIHGKNSCLSVEPDSTVNFFHHPLQNGIYPPGQDDVTHYSSYYPDRVVVEEEIKKVLPISQKMVIGHPMTPEKFNTHPASPSKPLHNSNHCTVMPLEQPSSPSQHQPKQFTEAQEKIQHEMAASFNAVHHHHPSFHNNNQAWLTHHQQPMPTNLEHPHHQLHPVEAPDSVHPHQMYPPMSSFGYHNGHANGYHETNFDHHNHHANSVRYDAAYNQQPR